MCVTCFSSYKVRYWERLGFEVPYAASDITKHAERYRVLRENVMLVVRDYNSNLSSLQVLVTI